VYTQVEYVRFVKGEWDYRAGRLEWVRIGLECVELRKLIQCAVLCIAKSDSWRVSEIIEQSD